MKPPISPLNADVFSGAPSSGKTSLLRVMQRLGFSVVGEVARAHFESQILAGYEPEEILADQVRFNREIFRLALLRESNLVPGQRYLLDRGVPDSIAYHRLYGVPVEEVIRHCRSIRYRQVFLLDRLPVQGDGMRVEGEQEADRLDELLEQAYRETEHEVIRVPVGTLRFRAAFVLSHMPEAGIALPADGDPLYAAATMLDQRAASASESMSSIASTNVS